MRSVHGLTFSVSTRTSDPPAPFMTSQGVSDGLEIEEAEELARTILEPVKAAKG